MSKQFTDRVKPVGGITVDLPDIVADYNYSRDSVLRSAESAMLTLKSVVEKIKDDNRGLNPLGELQSQFTILDCQIAALATMRRSIDSMLKSVQR